MKKLILTVIISLLLQVTIHANEEKPGEIKSLAAVLLDQRTGRVLWGKNEHTPMAMASTTKIMTAVIALENADLNDEVTVSRRASLAPKVRMGLSPGEKIKLQDLMYALMLESSNDAAVAIAEHVGNSVEEFCKTMTEKAKELGAADTVFKTPNGLDLDDHHSTAYDMALITAYALKNQKFLALINTSEVEVKSDKRTYSLMNKNRLLREYEGANGVKTGFTGKAGQCFVGSAKRGDMQLITVVFASGWGNKGKEQKWIDTKALLNYGFDNFEYTKVVSGNSEAGVVAVERSKIPEVKVCFKEDVILPLSKEEKDKLKLVYQIPPAIKAPVSQGDKIGSCKVYLENECFTEIDLLAENEATRHDLKTSLEKVLNTWFELGTNERVNTILPEF